MTSIHKPTLLLVALLLSCASPRPVLYPNPRYAEVGPAVARRDIDACMALAEKHGTRAPIEAPEGAAGDVVEKTVEGAATGGAVGAVVGNAGRGAAAGAAGGFARGLIRAIFRTGRPLETRTTFHAFVERCLRERGYEPLGWE